jgi:hypothetical protein
MSKIGDLVNSSRRLLTCQELRAMVGKPLSPCPTCDNPKLAVFQDGSSICEDCNPDHGRTVVMRLYCVRSTSGSVVAADWDDILDRRERRERGEAGEGVDSTNGMERWAIEEIDPAAVVPCPKCRSLEAWWDVWGHQHCRRCEPIDRVIAWIALAAKLRRAAKRKQKP